MAEFHIEGPKTKKLKSEIGDVNKCVFCGNGFDESNPPSNPDLKKIDSLFKACKERLDDVSHKILDKKDGIVSGKITLCYHRNCRATFASAQHIKRLKSKRPKASPPSNENECVSALPPQVSRRSQTVNPTFSWKENCFICGKACNPKKPNKWSMVETSIDSKSTNIYTKVLEAARERLDYELQTRLHGIPNGDLVAVEARYHRNPACLTTYTNKRSVAAARTKAEKDPSSTTDPALISLIEEFKVSIDSGGVYLLKTFRERYCELRKAGIEGPEEFRSHTLKERLSKAWPELSFIQQRGLSDLVCSSHIKVGEALCKAQALFNDLKASEQEQEELKFPVDIETTDEKVIHQAVGLLREELSKCTKLEGEYFSYSEISLNAEKSFVPPLLYKTLMWLTNEELFNDATGVTDMPINPQCLHIACDIINLATTVSSPKHLGLAVQLHHEYGSRGIIDTLHSLGYCISYDELRRFLTSAALYVNSLQVPTSIGTYIPPEILSSVQGGQMVSGVGDNWDHNEHTPDGKRTTHAMTTVVLQPTSGSACQFGRIKKATERSLSLEVTESAGLTKVVQYNNPTSRPEPIFLTPPKVEDILPLKNNSDVKYYETQEIVYNLARCGIFHRAATEMPKVPNWSAYHAVISPSTSEIPVSKVAYNPILMATPTEKSTVYTTLLRMCELAAQLGQEYIPVTFDLGILTKALEIKWAHPEELSSVILCEGGMHLLMAVFAAIGHLFSDAGLSQLLHESGVFAAGTVRQMMAGKDFDRALRGLKLVDEVLNTQFYKNFFEWCIDKEIVISPDLITLLSDLDVAFEAHQGDLAKNVVLELGDVIEDFLQPLISQFRQEGRQSPTFRLWDDFLHRIMLPLKLFISSTRNGSWDVHQSSKSEFLPLLYVGNRTNYARYLPVMMLNMKNLPEAIQRGFQDGLFVAKLSEDRFNSVWIDYALETTENKALKGGGGIIGLTLRGQSLVRWFLARPVTAQYATSFKENVCRVPTKQCKHVHHDTKDAATKNWNADVSKLCAMFDGSYIDPFNLGEPPEKLVNIATGVIATVQVQQSLLGALDRGDKMAQKFVSDRLCENESEPLKSFYDPMPRANVLTMAEMRKKVKVRGKSVSLDGQQMYMRLLASNSPKNVPFSRVMSFENAPVPPSLFTDEGMMNTCTKSDFMHKMEDMVKELVVTSLDSCDELVIDGHALIQAMPEPKSALRAVTFHQLSSQYLDNVMKLADDVGCNSGQIHNVFDKYLEESIKAETKNRRSAGHKGTSYQVRPDLPVPINWKQFLSVGENKSSLAECFNKHMLEKAQEMLKPGQRLFLGGSKKDETAVISSSRKALDIRALRSNQEEADTRLVLHAIYATHSRTHRIVVKSPDTDVLVLLVHHRPLIAAREVFFLTGRPGKHVDRTRFIPVHEIYNQLTPAQRKVLLPCYCLSGCDTVSSLFGHGKKTAFKLMMNKASVFSDLESLGSTPALPTPAYNAARCYVGAMYGAHDCQSLNQLRASTAKAKQISAKKLPPTEDAFRLHVLRATYQLFIWRHAQEPCPALPDPTDFGYERDATDGCLRLSTMTQSPAAPELLNDLICSCLQCKDQCPCFKKAQPCTTACDCGGFLPDPEGDILRNNPLNGEMTDGEDSDSTLNDSDDED